jgi:hypothetical protein
MALLLVLLLGYVGLTSVELASTRSTMASFRGFYAAEAGLNVRAEQVRAIYSGGGTPAGTPPASVSPCEGANLGSGDFACASETFGDREVTTYMDEPVAAAPIVIPRGETFQNLHATENHYVVTSRAKNGAGHIEATLEMHFKSRRVGLFQFPAFYDKDLEIVLPQDLLLAGPLHTNGDLYLGCDNTLDIAGQVTLAGRLFRGKKDSDTCMAGPVRVSDPQTLTELPACGAGRAEIVQTDVVAWHRMVDTEVAPVAVPAIDMLDPVAGRAYWDAAHLRIVLDLDPMPVVEVRNADGTLSAAKTALLTGCAAATTSLTLYNHREGTYIRMLDLDLDQLLSCADLETLTGLPLSTLPATALILHLTVDGPGSAGFNNYGVRLLEGEQLPAALPGGAALAGLTVASDQALYVQGHFNRTAKRPVALLADSMNVLSNGWDDAASNPLQPFTGRVPADTTIQAALLAGTDSTGGAEGVGGQDAGAFNGGLQNLMRLHEDWNGTYTLTFVGSFVSLHVPRHVSGAWAYGDPQYTPPIRNIAFDTDFENPALLPPATPEFVYIRQELLVRRFEM